MREKLRKMKRKEGKGGGVRAGGERKRRKRGKVKREIKEGNGIIGNKMDVPGGKKAGTKRGGNLRGKGACLTWVKRAVSEGRRGEEEEGGG